MVEWFWIPLSLGREAVEEDPHLTVQRLEREIEQLKGEPWHDASEIIDAEVRLGIALRLAGNLGRAGELQRETLARAYEVLDAKDRRVAVAVAELGLTELASGRIAQAAETLERARRLRTELYGDPSPELAEATSALALAALAGGDLSRALQLQLDSFEGLRQTLDPRGAAVVAAGSNLASIVGASGDRRSAASLLRRAIAERSPTGEAGDPLTLLVEAQLASGLPKEDFESSRRLLYFITRGHAEGVSEGKLFIPFISAHLARTLARSPDRKEWGEAVDLARFVVRQRTDLLGEKHPQTLNSQRLLAQAAAPHDLDLAVKVGSEAAESSAAVLGRSHVDTLSAFENLALLLARRGDERGAAMLRVENLRLRAADEGIVGDGQPPIENLAGTLTDPLQSARPEELGAHSPSTRIQQPAKGLLRRTAHVEIGPDSVVEPGTRFEVSVHIDCAPAEGPGSAELELKPPPGVATLTLSVWLVVSRHFEVEGDAIRPLELDLRESESPRLTFVVHALHPPGAFAEGPEVRVLFSYRSWPSGEVSLPVPLAEPAGKSVA